MKDISEKVLELFDEDDLIENIIHRHRLRISWCEAAIISNKECISQTLYFFPSKKEAKCSIKKYRAAIKKHQLLINQLIKAQSSINNLTET